ncbi:S41 family peptidase [Chitinophaga filiformis]|uniref:S41 family peptidase n=1 Tax=Chitinophaga filiformis TaxID=104663 RepID=UPI001F2E7439|nr:S41 family peptidase [Chitinophaga filiformis]MCF6407307.1 S41 family peptidase [Chitinophaga filiformis]
MLNPIRRHLFHLTLAIAVLSCGQPKKQQENAFSSAAFTALPKYPINGLLSDFDLLVSSLKEAHTGIYWYSSVQSFDSLVSIQRAMIKDSMNGFQFYNIVAPIVAFTKEDHCDISLSEELKAFQRQQGKFLPLSVLNSGDDAFILNDSVSGRSFKGAHVVEINGLPIKTIKEKIYRTFGSDGDIMSSRIAFLDGIRFAVEYAKVIGQPESFEMTLMSPSNERKETVSVKPVAFTTLKNIETIVNSTYQTNTSKLPASFRYLDGNTVLLTFNTFSNSSFRKHNMNFRRFTDSCFNILLKAQAGTLIIDMRENGGGSEGNEDYLFSWLTDKPYIKYDSVELSRFEFSFIDHTDYAVDSEKIALYKELRDENELTASGRILRKKGIYTPTPPRVHPFKGRLYILTSGWTYSGGAEFCSLVREHTNAVFIGQETGGGYYGNTSGTLLELTLPVTKLSISIPILRFNLAVHKGIPGRGVIPDFEVSPSFEAFSKGIDQELNKALSLTPATGAK